MVNINAIKLINQYIIDKNLKPMKKWSLRFRLRSSYQHLTILKKSIRTLLDFVSGNDTLKMLKSKKNLILII